MCTYFFFCPSLVPELPGKNWNINNNLHQTSVTSPNNGLPHGTGKCLKKKPQTRYCIYDRCEDDSIWKVLVSLRISLGNSNDAKFMGNSFYFLEFSILRQFKTKRNAVRLDNGWLCWRCVIVERDADGNKKCFPFCFLDPETKSRRNISL